MKYQFCPISRADLSPQQLRLKPEGKSSNVRMRTDRKRLHVFFFSLLLKQDVNPCWKKTSPHVTLALSPDENGHPILDLVVDDLYPTALFRSPTTKIPGLAGVTLQGLPTTRELVLGLFFLFYPMSAGKKAWKKREEATTNPGIWVGWLGVLMRLYGVPRIQIPDYLFPPLLIPFCILFIIPLNSHLSIRLLY